MGQQTTQAKEVYCAKQRCPGIVFVCFAFFKSYDHFSEESACLINSQSLTACQN